MSSTISESATASATSAAVSATSSAASGLVDTNNTTFKIIGVCLAIGSGLFIGTSFVIKKKGLLNSTAKVGNVAGEGHAYLKSPMWWTGMTLMIIGEILNFVAYAFTVAILVTPMGSISVVVAAILSHFILKETLTFFGWIGCTLCIMGSIILALNAPSEGSVRTIEEFKHLFISPGFLVWTGICIVIALVIVFYVAPRWGKTNMIPYISVCSLIGGISVSCTQGLGSSIVTSIQGESQVKNWFFWFLFVFVVITLLIEINYLNKALELFNTSMVVPVYFCYFTSATMITSFILYRGLKAPATTLITMVLGFLVTCLGITLLQMSKVDPTKLKGLDRRSTILLAASRHGTEADEKGDVAAMEEPGMDALRGGFGAVGSIIRARSVNKRMSRSNSSVSHSLFPQAHHQSQQHHLNTQGLAHLPRYQLSDNPVPEDDYAEHISLSEQATAGGSTIGGADSSVGIHTPRSRSTLKFDDADIVHQYGYYKKGSGSNDATHTVRQHDELRGNSGASGTGTRIVPGTEGREELFSESPAKERANPYDHYHQMPERKTSFSQLFGSFTHGPLTSPVSPGSAQDGEHAERPSVAHGFLGALHHRGQADDDARQVRGGAHRGVRDYPHLPKADQGTEREERAALVNSDSPSEDDHHMAPGGFTSPPVQTHQVSPSDGSISGLPPAGLGREQSRRPMGPR